MTTKKATFKRSALTLDSALRWPFDPKPYSKALVAWYDRNRRPLPWRRRWQQYSDPYHIWVSEIMLQQTVIKAVIPVYERFLNTFPDVDSLAAASEDRVRQAVRGLGYYRRFRMLHEAAKVLVANRPARNQAIIWPTSFEQWRELPGVGEYTAAAVSSIAFDEPAAVVDGNVERVFARLLDLREPKNAPHLKKRFRILAAELLYQKRPGDFNQALMELGQTVCTVTSPTCSECPLREVCLAYERSSQHLAPAAPEKQAMIEVSMRLTIVSTPKGFALLERPQTARFLKGTHGFFTELKSNDTAKDKFQADGWKQTRQTEGTISLGTLKHSITNHKIRAEVRLVETVFPRQDGIRFLKETAVEEQLVANLDRKAWLLYVAKKKAGFAHPPGP